MRDRARNELAIPVFARLGFNYKLSDIQAAIAIEQLRRIDKLLERRAEVARWYGELLADIDGVQLPAVAPEPQARVAIVRAHA